MPATIGRQQVEAMKRVLGSLKGKEHPLQFAKDVSRGLSEQFPFTPGKPVEDIKTGAKNMIKGGAAAFAFPLTGPGQLMGRFQKGIMENIKSLKAGKPVPVKGSQDEEFRGLQGKYGPITGSAIGVAKGTAEGAAGAQGGRMLGQAYKAWGAKGMPMGGSIKATSKGDKDIAEGAKKDVLKSIPDKNGDMSEYFLGKDPRKMPDPFTGKKIKPVRPTQQMGDESFSDIAESVKGEAKRGPMSDVWKLETPSEEVASEDLSNIVEQAMKGNKGSRKFLEGLWGEQWTSIAKKASAEGSTWYVWWMDGVRKLMSEARKGKK